MIRVKDHVQHRYFNLRLLIGVLLTFYGIVIGGYGLIADPRAKSGAFNLDLWWGILILVVGLIFLLLSRKKEKWEDNEE